MSHREQIERLAEKLGVYLSDRDSSLDWSWNGKNIATNGWKEESFIVHDIAHWVVCPEPRRDAPDFGLGIGPRSGLVAPALLSSQEELHEELRASVLGILIERAFGMNWKKTFHWHNWTEEGRDFLQWMRELKELNLVGHGGLPVFI
ncbi:MAG: hypothetical protein ACXABY_35965 [Candidatus Thorarchaeota archaeon]|jgi:hypothetical protein